MITAYKFTGHKQLKLCYKGLGCRVVSASQRRGRDLFFGQIGFIFVRNVELGIILVVLLMSVVKIGQIHTAQQ